MAYDYKVGNFQLNTVTGAQTVSGVGFQPKAVLFLHNTNTVTITTPQIANWYNSVGMADSTSQYAMWNMSPNGNSGLESTGFAQTSQAILGGINLSQAWGATLTGFTGDGFTLNLTSAPPDVYMVGYLAFGGADVDVKVGTFVGGVIGSQSITGLGFAPSSVIMYTLGRGEAFTATPTIYVSGAHVRASFGFSDGSVQRSAGFSHRDGAVTVKLNGVVQRNDNIIGSPSAIAIAMNNQASLTSLDADGFTLNNITNNSGIRVIYIALGGMACQVGQYVTPTVSGVSTPVTGLPFTPNAIIQVSSNQSVYNTIQGCGLAGSSFGATFSYGMATDPLEQFNNEATGVDYTVNSYSGFRSSSAHIHAKYQFNDRNTILEQSSFHSMNPDGFSVNASPVVGSGNSVISYLAIEGDGGSTPPPSEPTGGSGDINSPDSSFLFNMIGV